ncbi:MAG: hypothetical protein KUG82_15860 [Pseudomonadales bacterium]|nr:hypothetical protein [Pseudomonadales bacterium]
MSKPNLAPGSNNVIELFSGRPLQGTRKKILRIAPEFDSLEMLYTNDSSPRKLYSLKIVCWALRDDGEVVGMVPWLNEIVACTELNDPLNGRWEGYRDPGIDDIFYVAPAHKIMELETSAEYYEFQTDTPDDIIQEIPDIIGTHAVLTDNGFKSFSLIEVFSWRLQADGTLHSMLVDDEIVSSTPVLPGDECLYSSMDHPDFKYFFQHRIANKIKEQDPDALAAISLLIEP